MSLSPKTEPVLLANVVPGALTALAAVLTAFDWWDPTEEQLGALAGLLAALIAFATAFVRGKVDSPATTQAKEIAAAVVVDERDQAVATATEAVRAAETVTATQDAMAKLVAGEVVAKLDQQVKATSRTKAAPVDRSPPDLTSNPTNWVQVGPLYTRPPPRTATPIRVGSRVKVLSGKLEGRWGSVIETVAGRSLVFEDGPDDVDDWVPNDQLEPLGEWVTP